MHLTNQNAVERARLAATLRVAQSGDSCVEPQAVHKDLLHEFRLDRFEMPVQCAFCDDDDRFSLTDHAVL